jgi:hypothetical protein
MGSLFEPDALSRLIQRMGDPGWDCRDAVFLTGSTVPEVEGGWEAGEGRYSVLSRSPLEMVVEAHLPGPGVLVVRESLVAGWRVEVDGRKGEIVRADLAWRGVPLAAGRHIVRFHYRQPGLATGAAISGIALFTCLAGFLADLARRRGADPARKRAPAEEAA